MGCRRQVVLFCAVFLLAGCAGVSGNRPAPKEVRRIVEPEIPNIPVPRVSEGSLWSESGGILLYPDRRARRIGDIVTIRIVEDPEAKLDANTKTSRSSSLSAKLKFLGYMKLLAEKYPRLAQKPGEDELIKSTFDSKFDGKASSDRNGHVKAYISAMVVRVLPNGNLLINGKREVKVNRETQYITLSGVVRPDDISPSNEISSTYVANARITYSGVGPIADKQGPDWLGRIVDHVWPF